MANENQLIRALTEPTIILDDINVFTDESDSDDPMNESGDNITPARTSKQLGAVTPVVQVVSKVFTGREIVSLSIESGSGLPVCIVELTIIDKSFYSRSFPKDGDLMSIFISGKDDLFKPIRNDYIITSVSVSADEGISEASYDTLTLIGELNVPGYNAVKCFSKSGSSFKVLLETATDLNLGFASNEVDTEDEQNWLCAFERTKDFINDVTNSAWKNEDSFFHSFVDVYYYLNFVNIEPLFGEETEIEDALMADLISNDYGNDSERAKEKGKTILTDWEEHQATPFFIKKYELFNNSSAVNLRYGYKRYIQYYDALLKEAQILFVDPKTSEGAEQDKVLLKGRPREDFYLEQVQNNWMGIQYGENGENSHEKYSIAKVQNFQNLVHIDKMGLDVVLQSLNTNIRLMQSLPIISVINRDGTRKMANQPADESGEEAPNDADNTNTQKPTVDPFEAPFVIDKTVSGFYVVWKMKFIYGDGEFRHELKMVRREWPTPPTAGTFPPHTQ